jgi:hypothetical protein
MSLSQAQRLNSARRVTGCGEPGQRGRPCGLPTRTVATGTVMCWVKASSISLNALRFASSRARAIPALPDWVRFARRDKADRGGTVGVDDDLKPAATRKS